MADSTIDSDLVTFCDNWGDGPVLNDPDFSPYQIASTGAGHNTAAKAYEVGTRVKFSHPGVAGQPGPCTFIYLKTGTQIASIGALSIVVPSSATLWYTVSNKVADAVAITSGLCAVAISAITDAYYGWYLCGGVTPTDFVSAMTGDYLTTGTLTAGAFGADAGVTATTIAALAPVTTLMGTAGFALAADA